MPSLTEIAAGDDFTILSALIGLSTPREGQPDLGSFMFMGGNAFLFAPTDAAFVSAAAALGYSGPDEGAAAFLLEALGLVATASGTTLGTLIYDVLSYHVATGLVFEGDDFFVDNLLGAQLAVDEENGLLIDNFDLSPDATVVVDDIFASGDFVAIDQVLIPAQIVGPDGQILLGDELANFLRGGVGDDLIDAGAGDDVVRAGAGNDFVLGGDGIERLLGQNGDDTLDGGAGEDRLYGQNGDDSLVGGDDDDVLFGGAGNDVMRGDRGDDIFIGGTGDDTMIGNLGDDTMRGGTGNDVVIVGFGDDLAFGNQGDDFMSGNRGRDRLNGGDGNDTIFGGSQADVLLGNNGDDMIRGDGGNDLIRGHNGDDTLEGGQGNDRLFGLADDDVLIGGDGNDVLNAGTGNNTVTGGAGEDTFIFNTDSSASSTMTVTDYNVDEDAVRVDGARLADYIMADNGSVLSVTADGTGSILTTASGDVIIFEGVLLDGLALEPESF